MAMCDEIGRKPQKIRIDRIRIQGLKSIGKADVSLGSLNVLIGENGAGKSNFFTAFRLLNAAANDGLDRFVADQGGATALVRFGRKITRATKTVADCQLNGESHSFKVVVECPPMGRIQTEQCCSCVHRPSFSPFGNSNRFGEFAPLKHVKVYHFNDTSSLAGVRGLCGAHDYRSLHSDASNLAAFLYMLEGAHPKHFQRIIHAIRRVFPTFNCFNLGPDRRARDKILLEWYERGHECLFTGNALSDGTLRFMCLAALLLQPFDHPDAPQVIVIDEPELGLHPSAIALVVPMIENAARDVQVIVSTQSPTLVNALTEPESVIVVNRSDRGSVFERLDPTELSEWLEDYGLGDLWAKGVVQDGRQ
jgi:predicted ATPase